MILTCHSYVTVYIYPRNSPLKSLASYFGLQLFSLSHKHLMPHLAHHPGTRIPLTLYAYIAIGLLGLLLLSLSHFTPIGISTIFDFLEFISTLFGPNPSHTLLHASLHVVSHLYHRYFISQSALLMSSSIPIFDKHNYNNSNTWTGDIEDWFRAQAHRFRHI